MHRIFSKLVVIAAILAFPAAAFAATHADASGCACGADCPCGSGCPCSG